MILEIEYYKGDTFLYGKPVSKQVLLKQLNQIQMQYDRGTDNFIGLFCRMFGYERIDKPQISDYTYDRDTEKIYQINYMQ